MTSQYRVVSDVNKDGWEKSDFPILCETCMGDNPYVRMIKIPFGFECRICQRPFTVFKWKPGTNARYKHTVLCQTCAKMKNVCQTCVFDLEYGLPVAVRDKYMEEHEKMQMPTSDVNKEYFRNQIEKAGDDALPYGKMAPNPMLERMARLQPYYKRNRAKICSFYVKGECNRGDTCPYRHEMEEKGELSKQNIRDRFHGNNDPVANKIFRIQDEQITQVAPEDKSITTLYVGGLDAEIVDGDIRDKFYQYGEITGLRISTKAHCAFVTFASRESAELAIEQTVGMINVKGHRLRVMWGKPQAGKGKGKGKGKGGASSADAAPEQPKGDVVKPYYPSMDPANFGDAPIEIPTVEGPQLPTAGAPGTFIPPMPAPGVPSAAPQGMGPPPGF